MSAPKIAREAVALLRHAQPKTSGALSQALGCSPKVVDTVLAALVDCHCLIRVVVMRSGTTQFEYRMAATWTPKDEHFAACTFNGTTPVAEISAVTHTPAAPPPAPPPVAPSPSPAPRPLAQEPPKAPQATTAPPQAAEAPAAARRPRAKAPAPQKLTGAVPTLETWLRSAAQPPAVSAPAMGWKADERQPAELLAAPDGEPFILAVGGDIVCALNSLGELAIDTPAGVIQFEPQQALTLKRFLDNTSVLEELAGRGAL